MYQTFSLDESINVDEKIYYDKVFLNDSDNELPKDIKLRRDAKKI